MFLNFFKFIPIVLLLMLFMVTQSFAQQLNVVKSDAERIIKQYEQGNLTSPTAQEKQIIFDYKQSIQNQKPYQERILSPDATLFYEQNFGPSLFKENFDYPVSDLLTAHGWSAHSGSGSLPIAVATGNLTYTDYLSSGMGNMVTFSGGAGSREDVNMGLTEQNVNGATVYYSFLVNVASANATADYFFNSGDRTSPTVFTTFAARVYTQDVAGSLRFGIGNASATMGTTNFSYGTTYLVVAKYTINTGGNDECKLWVLSSGVPIDEVSAGTPEVTTTATNGQDIIDAIALRQGSNAYTVSVDGIRVGTAWTENFPSTIPPTGWTNVDNGSSGQIWEFNDPGGRFAGGNILADVDEDFAMLDSDNYGLGGSQNATLTTVAIDASSATNVSLGFDQDFYQYDVSYGLVEVSNDGTNWTLLATINTDISGYTEYDITSVAAGEPTVYVRWTYVGAWEFWWAIDNVVVYEPDAFPNPAIAVNPLDAELDVLPSTTLDWVAGGGAAPTGYRLYFGTDGGGLSLPTSIENNTNLGLVTQYTPASALTFGATYYWSLVPYNLDGDATGNPIWSFTVTSPIAQPYTIDFNDGTADGWLTNGFYLYSNHGTLGSIAVSMNFYSSTPTGWVQTPLVGPLTATSQLEFDYRIVNYSGYPGTATVITTDTFKIQISTDFGATFTNAYIINASNHVTSTNFATKIVSLGSYSGQAVIVRWDGKWGAGDYYFDIDNVKLREPPVVPIFSINPTSKDFGSVDVGTSSANQTFTISNTGAGTLTITAGNISLVGTDASQFILTDVNTYPINLTTGQTATVDVKFSPTTGGAKTADLQIIDNITLDATHTVALSGTGIPPATTPFFDGFEANNVDQTAIFGWTQQAITGTNVWTANSTLITYNRTPRTGTFNAYLRYGNERWMFKGFQLTGGQSYTFEMYARQDGATASNSNMTISYGTAPNAASMINVIVPTTGIINGDYQKLTGIFTPSTSGVYFVGIKGYMNSSPWYISIDDISLFETPAVPFFSITPTSKNFGAIPTGSSSADQIFTITNTQLGTLTITAGGISITGTDASEFALTNGNTYPINLTSGQTANIMVKFSPTSIGAKTASLHIVHNATGSPFDGPLTGTGYASVAAFSESFDDPTFPPANWSNAQVSGTGLWDRVTAGTFPTCAPHSGAGMARFASFNYTSGVSAILVTPAINFPGNYRVVFWMYRDNGYLSNADRVVVQYNTSPNLTGATVLGTINRSTQLAPVVAANGWYEYAFYVPAQGMGNTYIIFQGISAYGNNMFIDDVSVSLPLANDVGTQSIDVASNNLPGVITPKATVTNFGTNTNTFDVQMTITGGYTSTKTVLNLASGTSEQVTFDDWTATTVGDYTVDVCTQLVTDEYTNNDCQSKVVGISYWTNGNVVPAAGITYLGSGVAIGGYLFSMGGNTPSFLNTECYKYEVATDTWTAIAPLPAGRGVFATAAVGNYIYAIGGYDLAGVSQSTVYRYDIAGNVWTSVASLPSAIGWGKAVGYNNKVYIAGGVDDVTPDPNVLATVYVYDIGTDTWSAATSMPAARFGGAFSVTGNQLVYVAGVDLDFLYDDVYVGTIDGVDPTLIVWTSPVNKYPGTKQTTISPKVDNLASMMPGKIDKNNGVDATYPPGAMFKFDAAAWGTDGIIMAGGDPTASWAPANPNPCYVYKPATDTWEQQGNVPLPVLGSSLGTVNNGSNWTLIVATGYTGSVVTNATQIYTQTLGGSTTFDFSHGVSSGWNMVSVPGNNTAGMTPLNWWSDLNGTVYKFIPGSGYSGISTTAPGEGYWLKNNTTMTYNYTGIEIVTHNPIPATAGWNMLGGFEDVVDVNSLVPSVGTIQYPIYQFNPGAGYATAANLTPGKGYWVKVSQTCTITIPEALAKGSGEVVEYFKEDWGRIMITDATGSNYTLYGVKGEVELNNYELPPLPPAGNFDIRFGSGRIAEDLNSAMQTIQMSGVVYPITVRVEGMDIRLMDETGKSINVNLKSGEDVVIGDATIQKLMVSGETIPTVYALEQNYPNPFNPSTVIEFSLPEDVGNVKLSIYNALGEKVAELVNTALTAGKYQYQWNAQNVATGMYIYELRTDKFVSVKKMLLLK